MSTPDRPVFHDRPAVIGHRGLGKGTVDGLDENTLGSLTAAVSAGVDWVELDVSRSADGVLMLHHNPASEAAGFLVDLPVEDLLGHGVERLTDVLDELPADVRVDIDVKPVLEDAVADPDTLDLLLPVLRREQARRELLVTSFDVTVLLRVRETLPGLPTGLLTWLEFPLRIAVPMATRLGVDVVGLHHRSFAANESEPSAVHRDPARNVEVAHQAGLEVVAWCPGRDEIPGMLGAGVDALVVNDVPRTLPLVRSLTTPPPD
jgi:glycerophosphoryl diester phosphodiesterase